MELRKSGQWTAASVGGNRAKVHLLHMVSPEIPGREFGVVFAILLKRWGLLKRMCSVGILLGQHLENDIKGRRRE